jgi:hypothetical protein
VSDSTLLAHLALESLQPNTESFDPSVLKMSGFFPVARFHRFKSALTLQVASNLASTYPLLRLGLDQADRASHHRLLPLSSGVGQGYIDLHCCAGVLETTQRKILISARRSSFVSRSTEIENRSLAAPHLPRQGLNMKNQRGNQAHSFDRRQYCIARHQASRTSELVRFDLVLRGKFPDCGLASPCRTPQPRSSPRHRDS